MALINEGGKLLLQNGALASGAGCCCGGCSGPCDEESPCAEGCECVDGQCVEGARCCLPSCTCTNQYSTQLECEQCDTVNTCYEYLYPENPEDPCPSGWSGGGGFCSRITTVESCSQCAGYCDSYTIGPCGSWKAAATCGRECNPAWCQSDCVVDFPPTDPTPNYSQDNVAFADATGRTVWSSQRGTYGFAVGQTADGMPTSWKPSFKQNCKWLIARYDGEEFSFRDVTQLVNGFYPLKSRRYRAYKRILEVNCDTGQIVDVTSEALDGVVSVDVCTVGDCSDQPPLLGPHPDYILTCDNPLP